MTRPIRILIVDDHPMVAEGIEAILETFGDIEVVGTLLNAVEAIEKLNLLDPDVVLLDLNMPGMTGLAATELMLEKRPGTRILILTMHDSPEYIATALSHGASGYVLKDVPTDEIKTAIDSVMQGNEIVIAKAGKAAVKLVPISSLKPKLRLGVLKGKIRIADDFDAPLADDVLAGFEGR